MITRSRPLLLLAVLLLFLTGSGCSRGDNNTPVVRHGILDLSRWSVDKDGPVDLDGQWEFYWDQLLLPEDFTADAALPKQKDYLTLPGSWKGAVVNGQTLGITGQSTFRLHILPGPNSVNLGLRLFSLPSAYRLWVNGNLVATSGQIGENATTEEARRSLVLARLPSEATSLDLVLQISNHHFNRGGVPYAIALATQDWLERDRLHTWAWSMIFAGSLLVMVIYHLFLYFWKNKDVSSLYFLLYCILFILLLFNSDMTYWSTTIIFPNISPELMENISMLSYAISPSILYRFYRSLYPKEFIPAIQHLFDIRSLAFILAMLFIPTLLVYKMLHYYLLSSFFLMTFYTVVLVICLWHGHGEAFILLLGSIVLFIGSIHDICRYLGIIKSVSFTQAGMYVFILSQALALARHFSNAYKSVELLSTALERKNLALEQEMAARSQLASEIVTVSEEERRRLSHDLHDGLCQQLSGARLQCSALERRQLKDSNVAEEVSELASLLAESVSQAYDLSRGLWPVEHVPGDAGLSLEELARRMSESSGVAIAVSRDLRCAHCCNEHIVQLYRIAQEAVTNAVKYACANRISIDLKCSAARELSLIVADDGIGRTASVQTQGGLGMRIMAHRARVIGAELSIADAVGGGTVVSCVLTCKADIGSAEDA
jgi:signal transduction histidine kinase